MAVVTATQQQATAEDLGDPHAASRAEAADAASWAEAADAELEAVAAALAAASASRAARLPAWETARRRRVTWQVRHEVEEAPTSEMQHLPAPLLVPMRWAVLT